MPKKGLAELRQMQEALAARIRAEEAKARTQQRKEDNRRKILIGACEQQFAANNPDAANALNARLDRFLVRPDDRALFGLSARDEHGAKATESRAA